MLANLQALAALPFVAQSESPWLQQGFTLLSVALVIGYSLAHFRLVESPLLVKGKTLLRLTPTRRGPTTSHPSASS